MSLHQRFRRRAEQRYPPKHPHRPASQLLGPRMLERQHWREAESLTRARYQTVITSASSTNDVPYAREEP